MKLSFVVGNANQGYMTRMCIYSLMKYNKDYIDEIVISDNSSTDYSIQFFEENKYKDITKVITYDNARDRNPKIWYPHGMQWDLGLNACKNEYVLLSHADIEWKSSYVEKFIKEYVNEEPFLFGYGGGDGTDPRHRIHEWGMIIHVPTWKELNISFEGVFNNEGSYDTSSYMYKKAMLKHLKVISLGWGGIEDDNEWFKHYIRGGKDRKETITEIAREYHD